MQKYVHSRQAQPIIFLLLLLDGCASERPVTAPPKILSGDQMLRESQSIAHLSDRWKSGKLMVERGNTLVREAQLKTEQGNRMIDEGTKIMRESEESYRNINN